MSGFTRSYTERLTGRVWQDFSLPPTRQDAIDWYHQILGKLQNDPGTGKLEARLAMAVDLYVLALFMSCSQRLDPFTGRPEIDCDFQFDYAREWQFDSEDVVDTSAREHWKTTWGSHVEPTQDIFIDPNVTIALFSYIQVRARAHVARWMREMEQNEILKAAWDDVLWKEPRKDNAEGWSVESGATVKRSMVSISPTFGAYTFTDSLPTGSRFSKQIYDDCENEKTVRTEEMRKQVVEQFKNSLNLGGRLARTRVMGTFHHPNGVLKSLITELGMRHRAHKAEDVSRPAPDIAALFDGFGGKMPDGTPLPAQVRDIKLDGAAVYLHPLELARKRFREGEIVYYMQNMADPIRGQQRRLKIEYVSGDDVRYTQSPHDLAMGAFLYPCADPSKGKGDPCANLMFAVLPTGKIALVDGTRRKLSPDEWASDMFRLAREWDSTGELQQFRVEEYGQSTWTTNLRNYFNRFNYYGADIVACASYDPNRVREWARLEPLFRQRRILLPMELWVPGDDGSMYNLVRYFIEEEYLKFPILDHDDMVAAFALLEDQKAGELQVPTAASWRQRRVEESLAERGGGEGLSWMSAGLGGAF